MQCFLLSLSFQIQCISSRFLINFLSYLIFWFVTIVFPLIGNNLFATHFKPKLSSSSQWRTCILVSILGPETARRTFHVTSLFYPFTDFTLRYLKSPYNRTGLTVTTKDLDGSFVHSVLSRTSTRRFYCFGLLCLSCHHA